MLFRINSLINYCYDHGEGIEFQLFLITAKCLIPYEDKIGCFFNRDRYKKEIDLFDLYKNDNNEIIDNWIVHKKASQAGDDLLEYKIIPIIIANTIWENLMEEVFKAVTFFTTNKDSILHAIIISSLVHEYLCDTDIKDIEILTREKLINFSIKDLLIKNKIELDKNYIIEFEKERIKLISSPSLFDNLPIYKSINYIIKDQAINNRIDISHISRDSNSGEESKTDIKESYSSIKESYSSYLYKLRKGIINPDKLKISDKIPDIRQCLNQATFIHPLLGKCMLVKRTDKEVIIRNKTGLMRFRI